MIKNFPLLNSSLQGKNLSFFKRKDHRRIPRIQQRIRSCVKQMIEDVETSRRSHQMQKQLVLKYQFYAQEEPRYQTVKDRRSKEEGRKKTCQNFKRTFNRAKTDWDHNFIGSKYQEKVKEQKKNSIWTTKFARTLSENNKKNREGNKSVIKINDDLITQDPSQKVKYEIQRSKLSEQQLCRINKIREKRRQKIMHRRSLKEYEETKQLIKQRGKQYKNLFLETNKLAKEKILQHIWQPFSFQKPKQLRLNANYCSDDQIMETSGKISPWNDQVSMSNFSGLWSGKF